MTTAIAATTISSASSTPDLTYVKINIAENRIAAETAVLKISLNP